MAETTHRGFGLLIITEAERDALDVGLLPG